MGYMVVIIIAQRKYSIVLYEIKQYTFDQARKHGNEVKVSKSKKKKLDVYKNGIKICAIGDIRYKETVISKTS